MIVEHLCTHVDGARARGEPVLAGAGTSARVTLSLPLLDSIGLIEPGSLLKITEGTNSYRAMTRAARVTAEWTDSLRVRHQLEIERHG